MNPHQLVKYLISFKCKILVKRPPRTISGLPTAATFVAQLLALFLGLPPPGLYPRSAKLQTSHNSYTRWKRAQTIENVLKHRIII